MLPRMFGISAALMMLVLPLVIWPESGAGVIAAGIVLGTLLLCASLSMHYIPPNQVGVIRDWGDRVVDMRANGLTLVVPLVEHLDEVFHLGWRMLELRDAPILTRDQIECTIDVGVLYVVDPRAIRPDLRQSVLQQLHDAEAAWQSALRGRLQMALVVQPLSLSYRAMMRPGGVESLARLLKEWLDGKASQMGILVQDVQIRSLVPTAEVRRAYQSRIDAEMAAQNQRLGLEQLAQTMQGLPAEQMDALLQLIWTTRLAPQDAHVWMASPEWSTPRRGNGNGNGHLPAGSGSDAGGPVPRPNQQSRV